MDMSPDATQPDHTQVQDALATLACPRHARPLEPRRKDGLAGGLRDAGTPGEMLAFGGLRAHPLRTLFALGIGLMERLGRGTKAALTPKSRGRLEHPSRPVDRRFPHLAPLLRPSLGFGPGAKERL
jgi:hypothetical protein